MSTERELLENAAKAAGLKFDAWSDKITDYESPHYGEPALHMARSGGQCESWNPLGDDGDALRLALKLRIHIQPSATTDDLAPSVECYDTEDVYSEVFEVRLGDDPYAATRRAIVRAAASLGEKM